MRRAFPGKPRTQSIKRCGINGHQHRRLRIAAGADRAGRLVRSRDVAQQRMADAAQRRRDRRGRRRHQEIRRARFRHRRHEAVGLRAADAGPQAEGPGRGRGAERPRVPADARPAGRALDDARGGDGVLRAGRPSRQRALAERQGPCAGPCAGSRPRLGRSQRAHLPDARAPDLPHRFLRHRRADLPQDRAARRPVGAGQLDHHLQRDAPPPSRPAEAAVRAAGHGPARRSAGRPEALLPAAAVQLVQRLSHGDLPAAVHRLRRSASTMRRGCHRS